MQEQEIINKITTELLMEIKNSNQSFSNDEIKEKINQRLIDYISNSNENLLKKKNSEKQDLILQDAFTKIDDDNESFQQNKNDFDFQIQDNFDEEDINDNIEDNNDIIEETDINNTKNNKKFFEEVGNIYKNEFKQSISCFSNVIDSIKLISKTSLFELILVFLFLIIPAILAGCIAFLVVILLFVIWQIYLITKTIYKLFEKVEFSIKDTINNIKIKIKNYKKDGGFFKKLIFSNALYTLLMFNGVMYMIIKGMMLPVKSALDIEKIIANVIAKIEKGITTILKSPSELATANIKSQNLKENRKSKNNKKEILNEKKLKAEIKKLKDKTKLKDKPQQKQEKINEIAKALREQKNIELVNAIAKNIKNYQDKQIDNKINNKEILNSQNPIKEQIIKDNEILKIAEKPDRRELPSSIDSFMPKIDLLNGKIFDGLIEKLSEIGKNIDVGNIKEQLGKIENVNSSNIDKMLADARNEIKENQEEAKNANKKQSELFGEEKYKEISENYKHGEGKPLGTCMKEAGVDLSSEKALEYAFYQADINTARDDTIDAKEFEQYAKENSNITMVEYREHKLEDAEKQLNEEKQTFSERYDGKDCQEMLLEAMQELNYPLNSPLKEEQKMEVCKVIARQFPDDETKINAMKDSAEYIEAFEEKMRCDKELSNEKQKESTKFVDMVGEKANNHGNEMQLGV